MPTKEKTLEAKKQKMQNPLKLDVMQHLQTAIEVELSTIPIYLYTYYSIKRQPAGCSDAVQTFANKAGALIMSVAVEEMLHLSLASNILRSMGGKPQIYGRSPATFPTNLKEHSAGFSFGLTKLTTAQINQFLLIEKPEASDAPPEGKNWDTLGQFYDYIIDRILLLNDSDFQHGTDYQLADGKGYYASSNVDTIYPDSAAVLKKAPNPKKPIQPLEASAQYTNQDDSGNLMIINDRASAIKAIEMIKDQGEGNDSSHKPDDPSGQEDSHWYKFNSMLEVSKGFTQKDWDGFVLPFPDNPTRRNYPKDYICIIDLINAVYSYLLWMTQKSFELSGNAQFAMFYIGMHKGMIFILDKLIGLARNSESLPNNTIIAPTFENHAFTSEASAKQELVALCEVVNKKYPGICYDFILQAVRDLPDVNVKGNATVKF